MHSVFVKMKTFIMFVAAANHCWVSQQMWVYHWHRSWWKW